MKKLKNSELSLSNDNPNLELMFLDNSQMKILFKISDSTLLRWRKNNILKYVMIGRKCYYPYHLVMNFMKTRSES